MCAPHPDRYKVPEGFFGGKCAAPDCAMPIIRYSTKGREPKFCSAACRVAVATDKGAGRIWRNNPNWPRNIEFRARAWKNAVERFGLDERNYADEMKGELLQNGRMW